MHSLKQSHQCIIFDLQLGSSQEQNGSLSERLTQAEARLSEAETSSNSKKTEVMGQLEQSQAENGRIQVDV